MPRRNQIFIPGGYYHVYNRGHNKQPIFLHYKDYKRYITRLKEYLDKHPVTLLAFCLMPNHIHLLLRQDGDESLDRFIHRLHTAYTKYFNIKYERVGSVFQSRFKAKLIETDEYLLHVSRYIHLNPIELLHAQSPALKLEQFPWSSYGTYIGTSLQSFCDTSTILGYFEKTTLVSTQGTDKNKYKKFIEAMIPKIDQTTLEGISEGEFPL